MPYTSLRDNAQAELATRRRHIMAGIALFVSLATFICQTIAASRLSKAGYHKAVFMLYLTHSSWTLLAPMQVIVLFVAKRQSWPKFYRKHTTHLLITARLIVSEQGYAKGIVRYYVTVAITLALALNIAGVSWYLAVNWTSASDLTAIYNCSAFFAYAFSIPLLNEAFNLTKVGSVLLSIVGVLIIAYGGGSAPTSTLPHRNLGNLVISVGAVLYGLYEVLYKRIACPPQSVSSKKQAAFANVVASMIGLITCLGLWPVLIILHFTGVERFQLPRGEQVWLALLSVFSNMIFSGSFLVLVSLTSPVLGSVAAMLTTFLVPIVDWLIFGAEIGYHAIIGGIVVVIAFLIMSWASWWEMQEDGDDESVLSVDPPTVS